MVQGTVQNMDGRKSRVRYGALQEMSKRGGAKEEPSETTQETCSKQREFTHCGIIATNHEYINDNRETKGRRCGFTILFSCTVVYQWPNTLVMNAQEGRNWVHLGGLAHGPQKHNQRSYHKYLTTSER